MKMLVLLQLTFLVYITQPFPQNTIIVNENETFENGYHFRYQTSDGQFRDETGEIKNGTLTVKGFYSFIGTDGKEYKVHYEADENGYRILPGPEEVPVLRIGPAELASLTGGGLG